MQIRHPHPHARWPSTTGRINKDSPQANGLLAYWPLRGESFPIELILGNHGTFAGDGSIVADVEQFQCAELDGSGDWFSVPSVLFPALGNTFTFSYWCWQASVSTRYWIAGFDNGLTSQGFEIYHESDGSIRAQYPGSPVANSAASVLTASQWNHVVYIKNGTGSGASAMYLNGVSLSLSPNNAATFVDLATTRYFGVRRDTDFASPLAGKLSDLRLYNRALSAEEVRSVFDKPHDLSNVVRSRTYLFPQVPYAITPQHVFDAIDSASASSYSFSSKGFAWSGNRLLIATVVNTKASSVDVVNSLTTSGLTWAEQKTQTYDGATKRLTTFTAYPTSPGVGTITVDFAGVSQTCCSVIIDEPTNVDASGSVVQSKSGQNTGSTHTVTFDATPASTNANYGAFGHDSNTGSLDPESGYTELAELNDSTPGHKWMTQGKSASGGDATVSASSAASRSWGGIILELKLYAPGGGGTVSRIMVISWEALGYRVQTQVSSYESRAFRSAQQTESYEGQAYRAASHSPLWEAHGYRANAKTVSYEALKSILAALTSPWETLGGRSGAVILPWEAHAYRANQQQSAYEALGFRTVETVEPWESLGYRVIAIPSAWESGAYRTKSNGSRWEALAYRASALVSPWESLTPEGTIAAAFIVPWEALGVRTATKGAAWESLVHRQQVKESAWESLGYRVQSRVSPWESILAVASVKVIPWEVLKGIALSKTTQWESGAILTKANLTPWESAAPRSASKTSSWESHLPVVRLTVAQWEALKRSARLIVVPWESLSPFAGGSLFIEIESSRPFLGVATEPTRSFVVIVTDPSRPRNRG